MTAVAFGGLIRLLFTNRALWLNPVPRAGMRFRCWKELDPFASSPEKDTPSPAIRSRSKHRMQIHNIECHHTTGGFDVRVVDIAAMDSDFCDRSVQCVAVHGSQLYDLVAQRRSSPRRRP